MAGGILDSIAALLTVTAAFAYFNHYVLHLPRTAGLVVTAFAASLCLVGFDLLFPALSIRNYLHDAFANATLSAIFLDGVLGLLLFAGALDVDVGQLMARKWTILALATAGVAIATVLVAFGMRAIFLVAGLDVPLAWCFVFGALIAPTDPVAVLDVLRRLGVPAGLQATVAGESLFNDGVGIVLYTVLLGDAQRGGFTIAPLSFLVDLLREGGGGVALGLATGGLAFIATRGIDEYIIELMISLALVTGTFGIAQEIGVSGPVAVVTAGLLMGSIGQRYAVSSTTRDYLEKFWQLVDAVLNSVLFLLIGLEFAAITLEMRYLAAAALAIPLAVAVRAVSVTLPGLPLNLHAPRKLRAIALLTWAGLRGGVSVALALSLPESPYKEPLLTACYAVVIFTMIAQGLTLSPVARRLYPNGGAPNRAG